MAQCCTLVPQLCSEELDPPGLLQTAQLAAGQHQDDARALTDCCGRPAPFVKHLSAKHRCTGAQGHCCGLIHTFQVSRIAAQAERSAAQEALDALTERHTALTERHDALSDEVAELRSAAAAAAVGHHSQSEENLSECGIGCAVLYA
jgi:hypothetical protein